MIAAVLSLALLVAPPAGRPPAARPPEVTPALAAAAEGAGLQLSVLRLALRAQARAAATPGVLRDRLTVIDYSLPSRTPRLWVLDLARGRVLARELVAHGRNTGDDLARRFSNLPGSLQSSLGTFITGAVYQGAHGLSLRLRGIDPGLNDRAETRGIVVHGAAYVNPGIVSQLGRLGRSQGCPALAMDAVRRVIPLIRDGTVLFAYYPAPELRRRLAIR